MILSATVRRPPLGVVLVDLRGHGASQGFAAPNDLAATVSDLDRIESTTPPADVSENALHWRVASLGSGAERRFEVAVAPIPGEAFSAVVDVRVAVDVGMITSVAPATPVQARSTIPAAPLRREPEPAALDPTPSPAVQSVTAPPRRPRRRRAGSGSGSANGWVVWIVIAVPRTPTPCRSGRC